MRFAGISRNRMTAVKTPQNRRQKSNVCPHDAAQALSRPGRISAAIDSHRLE
jgi:hypothetical protein